MSLRQAFETHVETHDVKTLFNVTNVPQLLQSLTRNLNAIFDNYRASIEVDDPGWLEACWTAGATFFDLTIPPNQKTSVNFDQCLHNLLPGKNTAEAQK